MIGLVFNEPYAPHAGALVQSILDHADRSREYRFVFSGPGLSDDTIGLFRRQFEPFPNATFRTLVVEPPDWTTSPYFAPICFTRLRLPDLLPDVERLLYLMST